MWNTLWSFPLASSLLFFFFLFAYILICGPRDETDCCLLLTKGKIHQNEKSFTYEPYCDREEKCSPTFRPIFYVFSKYEQAGSSIENRSSRPHLMGGPAPRNWRKTCYFCLSYLLVRSVWCVGQNKVKMNHLFILCSILCKNQQSDCNMKLDFHSFLYTTPSRWLLVFFFPTKREQIFPSYPQNDYDVIKHFLAHARFL